MARTGVSGSNKQLNLTGGIYLLDKKVSGDATTWEVKWSKEVLSGKMIDKTTFEDKFPKAKANSVIKVGSDDH